MFFRCAGTCCNFFLLVICFGFATSTVWNWACPKTGYPKRSGLSLSLYSIMIFIITARKTQMAIYWGQIPLFWTKPFGTFGAAFFNPGFEMRRALSKSETLFLAFHGCLGHATPCRNEGWWWPKTAENHQSWEVWDTLLFCQLTENMAFPLTMAHPVSYLPQATGVRTYPGTSNLGTRGTRRTRPLKDDQWPTIWGWFILPPNDQWWFWGWFNIGMLTNWHPITNN